MMLERIYEKDIVGKLVLKSNYWGLNSQVIEFKFSILCDLLNVGQNPVLLISTYVEILNQVKMTAVVEKRNEFFMWKCRYLIL